MKKILKNSLVVFATIIVTIYFTDSILTRTWSDFLLYLEIGCLSIIICFIQYFIDKFQSPYYFLNMAIHFFITLALVLLFGYVFHWYMAEGIWIMCLMVIVAYVLSCFLGALKVKKDVELINAKIKKRKANRES